jgi:hypothetical protein
MCWICIWPKDRCHFLSCGEGDRGAQGILLKIHPAYTDIDVQPCFSHGTRGRTWINERWNTGGDTVRGSISVFGKGWENPSASIIAFKKKPQAETAIPMSMPIPGGTATDAKKKPFVWYSLKGTNPTANK